MTQIRWTLAALAALAAAATLGAAPAQAAAKDGKTLFTANKCNLCHTIQSQAIEQVKDPEEEGDEEDSKPKDLSDVGSKHDAKWIKDWLAKKIEVDGKTHRKKFSGEPADMNALADWLATLKKPAK